MTTAKSQIAYVNFFPIIFHNLFPASSLFQHAVVEQNVVFIYSNLQIFSHIRNRSARWPWPYDRNPGEMQNGFKQVHSSDDLRSQTRSNTTTRILHTFIGSPDSVGRREMYRDEKQYTAHWLNTELQNVICSFHCRQQCSSSPQRTDTYT